MAAVTDVACSRHMSGPAGKDSPQDTSGDKVYVESVLNRHARKLLSAFRLHDLAFFAANLKDYELVGWLRKERYADHFIWLLLVLVVNVEVALMC